MIFVLENIQ